MRIKKGLLFLFVAFFSIMGITTVNAATISENGDYTVVFVTVSGEIDGESHKAVKFNFPEGKETVQLSEISKDINPFSGYEFLGWKDFPSSNYEVITEVSKSDFSDYVEIDGTRYDKAKTVFASYDSDKPIKGSGTYYITLDGFVGTINGKSYLKIEQKSNEFTTVDLTQYIAVREGCTFVGWDYNGSIVKSISSSAFSESDAIQLQAVYTKNTFEGGEDLILKLDANGGKIDGEDSKLYDYLGGRDSGTSMSLLPYIPTRGGYTFAGWNSEADGTGVNYKYIFWREWQDENYDFISEPITLYATWTKNSETPQEPAKDTVKVVESSSATKGNIEFAKEVSQNYVLDIKPIEVSKELADKNVKLIADINILEGGQVVKISDTKMKVSIALPEELKGYNKYEVVYILNGEIKETIPATVENGYIVFETSHLSQYGIIATNVTENGGANVKNKPQTGDNITFYEILALISSLGLASSFVIMKKVKKYKLQ